MGTCHNISVPLRGGGGLSKEVALGQIEAHLATDLLFFFIFNTFSQARHSDFLDHLGQRLDQLLLGKGGFVDVGYERGIKLEIVGWDFHQLK